MFKLFTCQALYVGICMYESRVIRKMKIEPLAQYRDEISISNVIYIVNIVDSAGDTFQ